MEDSQKKIPADEVKYPDSTQRKVAHDAAQWIVNVYQSKNFWLYLAAIVALRAYLSTLDVFGERYWGWLKGYGVIIDLSLYGHTFLHIAFVPHFLFIGFCLIMNAIRKSEQ